LEKVLLLIHEEATEISLQMNDEFLQIHHLQLLFEKELFKNFYPVKFSGAPSNIKSFFSSARKPMEEISLKLSQLFLRVINYFRRSLKQPPRTQKILPMEKNLLLEVTCSVHF
jgi:hypothetical protein